MIERFENEDGKRKFVTALLEQSLVNGNKEIAEAISQKCKLKEYSPGETIIEQDGHDSDMFFIVSGAANVLVNGRVVAKRATGTHVGEMALIDPTAKRSATVKASEVTVVAILSENDFTEVADKNPQMWRRISVELASRLRERSKFHRQPNTKPMIFIGSSSEMSKVGEKLKEGTISDEIIVNTWTDGIFEASATAIESLASMIETYDIGVIVFGPDDIVESRGVKKYAPRDNAVLELGLLIGAFGRSRTFIIKPKGVDIKIPSDLLSVTCLEFDSTDVNTLAASVGKCCDYLRSKISSLGAR